MMAEGGDAQADRQKDPYKLCLTERILCAGLSAPEGSGVFKATRGSILNPGDQMQMITRM